MIKKFLSATLFGFLALGFAGTFVACDDYDDSDLRMRVEAVEGTLADLQAQIKSGAIIKSVTQGEDGSVIITTDSETFTIRPGKDGANGTNGADGKPGSVVSMGEDGYWYIDGVKTENQWKGQPGEPGKDGVPGKDAETPKFEIKDGHLYCNGEDLGQVTGEAGAPGAQGPAATIEINDEGYWVINGVTTDVKAQGEQGPAGQDGQDGQDGEDGQDGAPGKDADTIYYYPGDDGYWHKVTIHADGSETTIEICEDLEMWRPETADNIVTAVYDTLSQVLTLYNVEGGEGEEGKVEINLTEPLVGLQFVPDVMMDGMGVVYKYRLFFNAEKEIAAYTEEDVLVESNDIEMVYRLNPGNAYTDGIEWSFIGRKVGIATRAENDDPNLLTVVGEPVAANGELTLTANVNKLPEYDSNNEGLIFALKAEGNGRTIISDNATLIAEDLKAYAIYDKSAETPDKFTFAVNEGTVVDQNTPADFQVVRGKGIDLDTIAQLRGAMNTSAEYVAIEEKGFDVTYKYSKTGIKDATGTVQDSFITLDENGKITVNEGASAIGRKPVIKVEASVNETVVATAYVVLEIAPTDLEKITVTANPIALEYTELTAQAEAEVHSNIFGWEQINSQIYDVLDLTAAQFAEAYNAVPTVTGATYVNDKEIEGDARVSGIVVTANTFPKDPTATADFIGIKFTKTIPVSDTKDLANYGKITITYTPNNANAYPAVVLEVPYTVTDNCAFNLEHSAWISGGKYQISGHATTPAGYDFATLLSSAYVGTTEDLVKKVPANHSYKFEFTNKADSEKEAELNGDTFDKQTINFKGEIGAEKVTTSYKLKLVSTRANGELDKTVDEFTVEFVNPLEMLVEGEPLETQYANGSVTSFCIADSVTIKDKVNGTVIFTEGAVKDNAYGVSAVEFSYDIDPAYANVAAVEKDGKFTFNSSGWSSTYPVEIKVNVTATVTGIAVMSKETTVIVKAAE